MQEVGSFFVAGLRFFRVVREDKVMNRGFSCFSMGDNYICKTTMVLPWTDKEFETEQRHNAIHIEKQSWG